jgi:hypothetical protein
MPIATVIKNQDLTIILKKSDCIPNLYADYFFATVIDSNVNNPAKNSWTQRKEKMKYIITPNARIGDGNWVKNYYRNRSLFVNKSRSKPLYSTAGKTSMKLPI